MFLRVLPWLIRRKMKTILITGGAGFIGSNFIKYMLNKYNNYKIINLDLLTYAGNLQNLKDIENNPNYTFIKGSITDKNIVTNLFEKYHFNYVINFAAETHVDRSIEDSEIFIKTNVLGTQVLLDTAKKYWIDKPNNRTNKKFIQISTDEVYGSLGKTGKFTETTPLAPNSPYSASKAGADMLAIAYNKTYGLPINITRCSNNYGPYQHSEKLIPLIINNCLKNKEIPIYGDGMQIRDWLYVKDHCSALDIVLHKGKTGEIYNIGGNNEKTNIEIVKLIIDTIRNTIQSETKSKDVILSEVKHVADRPGHDKRYAIDNTKITKLGWHSSHPFKTSLTQTINWYLKKLITLRK